jgi:hypothetical protein
MKRTILLLILLLPCNVVFAQEYAGTSTITRTIPTGVVREEQATEHLTATNAVEAGATAHYTAGQSITLQPGFLARAGSVFQAVINPVNSRRSPETGTTLTARAFPNPFETTTTVEYNLPEAQRLIHTLTDAAGRPVARPNGQPIESPGIHQTSLDLSQLPTGIYLYQLKTANEVKTLRLIKK